jgi:hypothetical protein
MRVAHALLRRTLACRVPTLQKVARKPLIPLETPICDFLALTTAPRAVRYSCERWPSSLAHHWRSMRHVAIKHKFFKMFTHKKTKWH